MDKKESLAPLLSSGGDVEISINVGSDDTGLEDCSVIKITCNINDGTKITAGVVGPMRMDYSKIVSILKNITQALSDEFDKE